MKVKVIAIVALTAIGLGATAVALGGLPANAAATTQYLTSAVATGNVADQVAATGTVATSASHGMSFGAPSHLAGAAPNSSATWTVTSLTVSVGDTVAKGDVLATADTTDLQRQLTAANDALRSANLQLKIAKQAVADASTTAATRQAKVGRYGAKTGVATATKSRDDLREQIRLATLTAPIDGLVTAVNIVDGLDAPAGDAIVIDALSFQLTADVVESDLAAMAVGQIATVSIGAIDAVVPGTVTAIAPTAAGNTTGGVVSYAVTVSLDSPPPTVRAGMTADVTITIASVADALTVPAAALRGTAGTYSVLVLGADGTAVAQPVEVGLVTNTTAEIKSGLTDGQTVVTGINTAQTGATTTGTTGGFGGAIPGGGFGGGGLDGGGRRPQGN